MLILGPDEASMGPHAKADDGAGGLSTEPVVDMQEDKVTAAENLFNLNLGYCKPRLVMAQATNVPRRCIPGMVR